jgi:phage terminase large subunit GpA-like protein
MWAKEAEIENYTARLLDILQSARFKFSTIKPSDWNEQNRSMDSSLSRYEGKFSYDITPYTREIVDCLSPDHPARIIAVMKGAQIGFSTGVIEAGIGWIISQNPGNILFLTGHADLSEEAVTKIDQMIDSCGIRSLIRPSVMRAKAMKTGDTNTKKEFPGGSLVSGSAGNHKLLRQRSVRYGFIDDFEAAKGQTKESGSTRKMIEQRFAAYYDKMKLYYISTPELKHTSNIEPVYQQGDQRRYNIPCPCCGEFIFLEWSIPIDGTNGKEIGGITYKLDAVGKLIPNSVGYICQRCAGFFTDKEKHELNLAGHWKPTAEPSEEGFYSYHLSSLYAPHGMYDWKHYVNDFLRACPPGQKRNESLYKAFVNLVEGKTYEQQTEAPEATQLQRNTRNYEIGIIPEKLSMQDGNGRIMFLTCACDLNGTEQDARLDYEIVAYSENGATYSIQHGSIGTFVPREGEMKHKEDREHWTYEHHRPRSVWPELEKLLSADYHADTGRKMKIFFSGVDCGHYSVHAYAFVDKTNCNVVGLKGKDADKHIKFNHDLANFRPAKERGKLYLVEVNQVKDELAELMKLRWDAGNDDYQPFGFMNYPTPSGRLYLYNNFFSHYEAEHKVPVYKDNEQIAYRWEKKSSTSQNHMWDVRVYNMALKDIIVSLICNEAKIKNYTWADFINVIKPSK